MHACASYSSLAYTRYIYIYITMQEKHPAYRVRSECVEWTIDAFICRSCTWLRKQLWSFRSWNINAQALMGIYIYIYPEINIIWTQINIYCFDYIYILPQWALEKDKILFCVTQRPTISTYSPSLSLSMPIQIDR